MEKPNERESDDETYRLKKIVLLATLSNESFAKLTAALLGPTEKSTLLFFMQFVLEFFVGQIDMASRMRRLFQLFRRLHEMHTAVT